MIKTHLSQIFLKVTANSISNYLGEQHLQYSTFFFFSDKKYTWTIFNMLVTLKISLIKQLPLL